MRCMEAASLTAKGLIGVNSVRNSKFKELECSDEVL